MRYMDFSSWQGVLMTVLSLALITLIGVGIRLVVMQTIQQRRERENRQINERLRTLIAAYRSLGGSFTGNLAVDPSHRRDWRQREQEQASQAAARVAGEVHVPEDGAAPLSSLSFPSESALERRRQIRDTVEAALSDILLLGTEEQVRLAAAAASDMVAGKPIHTAELVNSLRDFIRQVLALEPVPSGLPIPLQGPTRPSSSARGKTEKAEGGANGRGGAKGGAGMGGAGGMGLAGLHVGAAAHEGDPPAAS